MNLTKKEAEAMTRKDPSYRWKVLGIVMVGTLMSALDSSIVNVSVPAIMADFGASINDIEWIITGYMLAFAASMPLTAWLREKVGHKFLYTASLVIFTLGSVLCGIAWNLPTLIFARVIQAIGGGALTPTGMAMITESFSPKERGKALGFWAMGAIMGPAFGPTVGGYLTKYFGWPSIFLINLPIGLIGIYYSLKILKADRPHGKHPRPFDSWGFAFLATFLVAFLLGISKGESEGWTSTLVVSCGIISFFSIVGFLLVESLTQHGIIDLGLLKRPVFAACMILTAIRSVALYGGTFLLPVFLQNFRGLDEVQSGLILLPGSLLMGLLMPITGRLGDKMSPRLMGLLGFLCMAFFFYQYRYLDLSTSNWGIIWPTLWRGIGVALLIAPLTATAMNAVPTAKSGMASSMLNLIQQVGGSIGIAVLGMILSNRTAYHLNISGSAISKNSDAYQTAFGHLASRAHDLGLSHTQASQVASKMIGQYVGRSAGVEAFQDAFLVGAVIVFISTLAVFLLPSKPLSHGSDLEHMVME
jgi:DHA2 family multidrug resistance protein